MGEPVIKFKKEEVLEFLDLLITFWREEREKQAKKFNIDAVAIYEEGTFEEVPTPVLKAICYIDAFQSVRASLFGDVLKETQT